MATRKQRISQQDRAFSRGVSRVLLDDQSKPKPPLDPIPQFEPKKMQLEGRFEAVVDPIIQLTDEAGKRIEKALRRAVLIEISQLEELPEVLVRRVLRGGSRGIEVRLVRY